ncbi:MAG: ABC transporter permease, partial [Melioribacteraceae bacterium]|nr:ABC transporter permease [Melioribacteraceae bacterium]
MRTILNIIKKEFLQFKRDPKMFGIILIAPVIQLIFLGYAANFDVNTVHTTIIDFDKSETSRRLLNDIYASGYFTFDNYTNSYDELQTDLESGKTILGLVIPNDFEKQLNKNSTPKVQAIFDGSDGNTAAVAAGYINAIINDFSQNVLLENLRTQGKDISLASAMHTKVRVWYNPELKTRYYMIPGIVGLLLMIITLALTSLAVVKEKEIGTLEQLIVTPIKSYQLIIGKLVPFIILGFAAIIMVLSSMAIIFDITVRGSIIFLFFSTFIYILSTLGLGLFVSTISKTQQQAMIALVLALAAIVAYVWVRFGTMQYGLAAIVALVHDEVLGAVNDQQLECLANALESCDAIMHHVNDLVDVARFETGKFAFNPCNLDLVP